MQDSVVVVQVLDPGSAVATYEVIAAPPSLVGAVHVSVADPFPPEASRSFGAVGTVAARGATSAPAGVIVEIPIANESPVARTEKGIHRTGRRNLAIFATMIRPVGLLATSAFPLRCAWSSIALPIKGSSKYLECRPARGHRKNRTGRRYRERH